ncbi:hypothetical protein Tco_1281328, partial [Tanacetum coccineum]
SLDLSRLVTTLKQARKILLDWDLHFVLGYNNNTGEFQMLRMVNPLSVVYRSPSLSMLVGLNDMNLFHLWILFLGFSSTPSSESFFSSAYSSFDLKANEDSGFETLVILGNHIDNDENWYICAWLLEVEAAVITSWRVLFVMHSQNIAKLIGFIMDDDPIVVVDMGHEIVHTLQVYDRPSQQFHTLRIVGNGGSLFIGPYKESLILLNV